MLQRLLLSMSMLILFGCASEKRLGESRIQPRRYAKGLHVQHHRPWTSRANPETADGLEPRRVKGAMVAAELGMDVERRVTAVEWNQRSGLSSVPGDVPDRLAPLSPRSPVLHKQSAGPSELMTDNRLPEPIAGRHPASVPGFILSLGWAMGIIGELAIERLGMPIPGAAFLLGLVASILGYFVSRRAYRLSLQHPELYPRYRLSRAARIISLSFLAPVVVYVAVVLLFVFVLLGGGVL